MDETKLEPVVNAKPVEKKKGLFGRLAEDFFYGSFKEMSRDMFGDIVVPAIKDIIMSMLDAAFSRDGKKRGSYRSSVGHRAYNSCYDEERRSYSSRANLNGDRSDAVKLIVFDTKGDADIVLDTMAEIVDREGQVSVAQYYELSGNDRCSTYTDRYYGWLNLNRTRIVRDNREDGWILDLTKPVHLR